ncbi:hypothetical protein KGF54_004391 [Candida jiufengensis]|uniref:uncharacterized protein n=1 Tax=Candida jiufengensis TaxID=497108 RepID=UPI0022256770|nr:uncharacterized protein KGF54_004391 [Candida jiufengensis]KAI5951317.1 hypothetical protein KGF54_004391 [Candida jiufengensis]
MQDWEDISSLIPLAGLIFCISKALQYILSARKSCHNDLRLDKLSKELMTASKWIVLAILFYIVVNDYKRNEADILYSYVGWKSITFSVVILPFCLSMLIVKIGQWKFNSSTTKVEENV